MDSRFRYSTSAPRAASIRLTWWNFPSRSVTIHTRSGRTSSPAFKEMMQDVTDGNINCVIVKDLSRLGREYIETGRYLRRVFPAYGVRFIAITDSIDTAHDSGDDMTVSVKTIMNEAYCRDISIKTRSSLDVKRRNGDFVGAFPVYGYMKAEDNKNLLVPDPYAARVVCDIFRIPAGCSSPK